AIAKKKVKARRPIPVSAADATIINNVDDNDNGNGKFLFCLFLF
ncbi:MAG: hypothetical protein ACI8RD_013884, partial [Bacillariaceae sp.]